MKKMKQRFRNDASEANLWWNEEAFCWMSSEVVGCGDHEKEDDDGVGGDVEDNRWYWEVTVD